MKRKFRILLLIALLSTACSPLKVGNAPTVGSNVRGMDSLAGLTFKPLSVSNARLLDNPRTTPAANQADNVSPMKSDEGSVAGSNPSVAVPMPAVAGGSGSWYDYCPSGLDEGLSLISASEAETAGFEGSSFQAMLTTIVSPVVRAWASDARLTSSYGLVDSTGRTDGDNGWHVRYVSRQKNESLDFAVMKSRTVIIRLVWEPWELSPEKLLTDSATALKILQEAIVNKETRSEEEKSGMDYFLKTTLSAEQTKNSEILYQIPTDARWSLRLQSILGHLVWEIESAPAWNPIPDATTMIDAATGTATPPIISSYWLNDSARGMIDAQNGALIRLTRPGKNYYEAPSMGVVENPAPSPRQGLEAK